MPIHANSDPYTTVVAVPAGVPSHSARKQPVGRSLRKRRQSANVWFQPAKARSESAKPRSASTNRRTVTGARAPVTVRRLVKADLGLDSLRTAGPRHLSSRLRPTAPGGNRKASPTGTATTVVYDGAGVGMIGTVLVRADYRRAYGRDRVLCECRRLACARPGCDALMKMSPPPPAVRSWGSGTNRRDRPMGVRPFQLGPGAPDARTTSLGETDAPRVKHWTPLRIRLGGI